MNINKEKNEIVFFWIISKIIYVLSLILFFIVDWKITLGIVLLTLTNSLDKTIDNKIEDVHKHENR